jgi:hypothetical protein
MSHPSQLEILQIKRDQLKARLVEIGDMRPGSLVERFRKCGKPTCHCAEKDAPGHGPCYSLTHAVAGKTVTRIIPKGAAVERTRQQIAEYQRFRQLVRELITVSEQIGDAQMASASASRPTPVKKKIRSRRCWPPTSCTRLRRSWAARRSTNSIWRRWKWPCANRRCS